MSYYKICPVCEGSLDPEEKCNCTQDKKKIKLLRWNSYERLFTRSSRWRKNSN